MKVEVLRGVIGGYDDIVPLKVEFKFNSIQITNQKDADKFLGKSPTDDNKKNRLVSRSVKFSEFTTDSDIRIWVDGNIEMPNLNVLLKEFIHSNALIALAEHPERISLKDELKACLIHSKINLKEYFNIKSFLALKEDNLNNLCQSGVMIRRKSKELDLVFNSLLELLNNHASRDQIFVRAILNDFNIPTMLYSLEEYPINISSHKVSFIYKAKKKIVFYLYSFIFKIKLL